VPDVVIEDDAPTVVVQEDVVRVIAVAQQGPIGPSGVGIPATATTLGGIKLGGDLGGTADAPTVPGLAGKAAAADLTSEISRAQAAEATKAADSAVVHLTGNETITGIKTFTSPLVVPSASFPESAVSGLTTDLASKLAVSNNLSDLGSASIARANLGLGSLAVLSSIASTSLSDSASLARLASPALTGVPTAPTASLGTNTTQLATTAFVLANGGAGDVLLTGNQTITGPLTFNAGAFLDKGNQVFDARAYGVVADGLIAIATGAVASGSATLTMSAATFSSADVGKGITVAGAGSGQDLRTTILAYVSSTQVTLADAAITTVTVAKTYYGTINTPFINAAITDAAAGGIVELPPGTLYLYGRITPASGVTLRGKGMYVTTLLGGNEYDYAIYWTGSSSSILNGFAVRDLSFDGQNLTNSSHVQLYYANNCEIRNVYFKNIPAGGWFLKFGVSNGSTETFLNNNNRVIDCVFDTHAGSLEQALVFNSQSTKFVRCKWMNNIGGGPIVGLWQKAYDTIFDDCEWWNNPTGQGCVYFNMTCDGTVLNNPYFNNCGSGVQGAGESDNGPFGLSVVYGLTINNPIFIPGSNSFGAVALSVGSVVGASITNPTISGYEIGITIHARTPSYTPCMNWSITGGQIFNCNPEAAFYDSHPGIAIADTCDWGTIDGVSMFDNQGSPTQRFPISINAGQGSGIYSHLTITNNRLSADIANGGVSVLINSPAVVNNTCIVSGNKDYSGRIRQLFIGNTGLMMPSADDVLALNFTKADGTTTVLAVDTTHRSVGINTAAPDSSLHIPTPGGGVAVAHFGDTTNQAVTKVLIENGWSGSGVYGVQVKNASGGTQFAVDGTGFVGIGVAAPDSALQILSSGGVAMAHIGSTANVAVSKLLIENGWSGSGVYGLIVKNGAGTTQFSVDGNGNVGVGTATPSTALQVVGSVTATAFAGSGAALTGIPESGVTNLAIDLAALAPLASPTFTGVPSVPTASPGTNTTQAASTAFVMASAVTGAVLVTGTQTITGAKTFTGGLNVGGGTHTAPLSMGSSGLTVELAIFEDGTDMDGFGVAPSEFRIFGGASGTNHIVFGKYNQTTSTFTEQMRLDNSGNLGIGKTPSTALDVNGTVTATAFAGALTGNVTGNVSGSSGSSTGNAATVTNATLTTALTVNTGTLTLTANSANTSVLTIGAGAVSVSGANTGDQTNISGNAATVTTNANLTGVITSSGNATSIASQTGTGTKFVVDTSPTLVTPVLGVATGTGLILTGTSANLLTAGPNGATNPALVVDGSFGSAVTGLNIKSYNATNGVRLSVLSSGADDSLYIDAKGAGSMFVNSIVGNAGFGFFIKGSNANTFAVGASGGTTSPAFSVDSSAASQVTGLNLRGLAVGNGLVLQATSSGSNENVYFRAKGTGTITINDQGSAGSINLSAPVAATKASVSAFAVGPNGSTNPTLNINTSASAVATGLNVVGAAAAGGLAVSVISSGSNENLTIDAKGSGALTLNGTATGGITLGHTTTHTDATNIVFGTSTGTKIGTATTQKLAFYNSAPIVQPTGDILGALSSLGLVASPVLGVTSSLSSGTAALLTIAPAITQTGTAGFTGVLVNVTETSHGSGTRLLQDWQVGGSTQMSISDAGVLMVGGVDVTFTLGTKAPLDSPSFTTVVNLPQHATSGGPAYVKGGMYFDTTLNKLRIGGASAWETVTSS
jgi:Lower baseplate protein N-terminal domain